MVKNQKRVGKSNLGGINEDGESNGSLVYSGCNQLVLVSICNKLKQKKQKKTTTNI